MQFIVTAAKLAALAGVGQVAATDQTRPLLTGILLEVKGNEVTATATDSYALARLTVEAETTAEADATALVSAKEFMAAAKSIKHGTATITIPDDSPGLVMVEAPGTLVGVNHIPGQFPNINGIIPSTAAYEASNGVPALGLNATYLAKFAKIPALKESGGAMRLEFIDEHRPIRISSIGSGFSELVRYDFLLMPVRVSR